jgi:gliding motility-associated-like protein
MYYSKPVFDLGPDLAICNNQPIVLDIKAPNAQYLWSTGSNSSQLTVSRGGIFWGKATNLTNSCFFIDSILIDDRPIPAIFLGKDTILCETEELQLNAGIGNNYPSLRLQWQDGTVGNKYKVTKEGLYYVRAANNCASRSDSIVVKYSKCKLGIPNAFTPNGDGHNDQFRPKYGSEITNYQMLIFNRFGQKIFESTDRLKGWDGKLNGRPQPTGTYAWLIQYTDHDTGKRVQYNGTVVLIR